MLKKKKIYKFITTNGCATNSYQMFTDILGCKEREESNNLNMQKQNIMIVLKIEIMKKVTVIIFIILMVLI